MKILITAYYVSGSAQDGGSSRFMRTVIDTLRKDHNITASRRPTEINGFDLIICSHHLRSISSSSAYKVCISHGLVADETFYAGADRYISISEEVRKYQFKKTGIDSEVIGQPIIIREKETPNAELKNILVIKRGQIEPSPFLYLSDNYNLRYSDMNIPIENQISWADLCITLGRGVLESMGQGKPVIVADNRAYIGNYGDGYVTRDNISEIAKCNFSGRRFRYPITQEWLNEELLKYNPNDSDFLHNYVKENHEAGKIVGRYLESTNHSIRGTVSLRKVEAGHVGKKVSIIIPVFNQHEMTNECVKAVRDNTSDYEIIIVDNGSEPRWFDTESINIRNEENLGFPVAVNQGIQAAKHDVIILLNNDVIVTPGWAERLVKGLDEYDIIGPCTNYCAGSQRLRLDGIYCNINELNAEAVKWSEMHNGRVNETNWVIGFCMAFKKSLYDEIGKFDESIWPSSGEEIDFCLRAKQAGKRIGIAFDVYVHHEGSVTFKDINKEHPYQNIIKKSEEYLRNKWGDKYNLQ